MSKVIDLLNQFDKLSNEEKEAFLKVVNLKPIDHVHVKIGSSSISDKDKKSLEDMIKKIRSPFEDSPNPYINKKNPFGPSLLTVCEK